MRAYLSLFNVAVGRHLCWPLPRPLLLRCGQRHLCISWQCVQKMTFLTTKPRCVSEASQSSQGTEQMCNRGFEAAASSWVRNTPSSPMSAGLQEQKVVPRSAGL